MKNCRMCRECKSGNNIPSKDTQETVIVKN